MKDKGLDRCLTHDDNLKGINLDLQYSTNDPCLGYHDPTTKNMCAFCKAGNTRILTEYKDAKGVKHARNYCGTVRTPNRDSSHVYTYLNPDSYSQDDLAANKFECIISPWYSKAVPDEYTQVTQTKYYPRKYQNITDSITEWICVPLEPYVSAKSCQHTGASPTAAQLASLDNDANKIQRTVIDQTVGCGLCGGD